MVLSAFGIAFGMLATFIIMVGVFTYFTINQKIKRVSQTDISKIEKGYFHRSFTENKNLDHNLRKELLAYLDTHNAKIIRGTENEIIAYINDFKNNFFKGPKIDFKLFPIRIIISQQQSETRIQLDESRNIKKLAPQLADIYTKKYQDLFDYHTDQLTTIIRTT